VRLRQSGRTALIRQRPRKPPVVRWARSGDLRPTRLGAGSALGAGLMTPPSPLTAGLLSATAPSAPRTCGLSKARETFGRSMGEVRRPSPNAAGRGFGVGRGSHDPALPVDRRSPLAFSPVRATSLWFVIGPGDLSVVRWARSGDLRPTRLGAGSALGAGLMTPPSPLTAGLLSATAPSAPRTCGLSKAPETFGRSMGEVGDLRPTPRPQPRPR
jgi:hypothetical protein